MLTENQLFANRYRLMKRLGQGAFSEVWKAEDTKVGNLIVALKVYAPDKGLDEDGAKVFGDEFAIVFNIHHQNLLTPSTFDEEKGSPYLVLPYCERGSALRLIGKMDEKEVARFLHDVSSALVFLHQKEIVHQDIKPDNVLIDSDGNYLLTDFGISTRMRSTLRRSVGDKKSSGTRAYMGPERFGRMPSPIKASDIWSLGATVYELMVSDVPFGEDGGLVQMMGALTPEVMGSYSAELKQLVELCLSKETWDRPTAEQIRDICDRFLRTGKWDLAPMKSQSYAVKGIKTNQTGRPTERKVYVNNGKTLNTSATAHYSSNTTKGIIEAKDNRKLFSWIFGIMAIVAIVVVALVLINRPDVKDVEEPVWTEEIVEEKPVSKNLDPTSEVINKEYPTETSQIDEKEEVALIEKYYFAKNYAKALPLAQKYAEKGNAEAQYYLANMYRRGYGVKPDTAECLRWYRKAADQGHRIAQCTMGYMYDNGYGVEENCYEAVRWYRKSAAQGYAIAEWDLGLCYEDGRGVEQNYIEAKKWYQKAANQGYQEAETRLYVIQRKIEGTW